MLIIEPLLDDAEHGASGRELDIAMLAMAGGRERTQAEYRRLFDHAGLTVTGVHRVRLGYAIPVATPTSHRPGKRARRVGAGIETRAGPGRGDERSAGPPEPA